MIETANESSLLQILGGSVLGLFGGMGATFLWEGIVRPWRDSRNVARSLVAELRVNKRRLDELEKSRQEKPETVPLNLRLATFVFDSVAEKIAELPEELHTDVVTLYDRFHSLNTLDSYIQEFRRERNSLDPGGRKTYKKTET